jgi:hypothetical protein
MFGNAGVVAFADRPVTEQFTAAAPRVLHWPWRALQFKTLWRNDGCWRRPGVHRPRDPDPARLPAQRWFDGAGRPLPDLPRQGRSFSDLGRGPYDLVQLNHYALQSMESFLLKADRGRANRQAAAADAGYWVERNFAAETDRSILPLAARAAPLRDALHADPELGRLHAAAVAWRRRRLAELLAEESGRAAFGRLMLAGPTRVLSQVEARLIWSSGRIP